MIFCITLFQRAASRVKKRQSGAEDPRLRAACVNRVLCPLVARCRPAHVIGQHGQRTMRGRVAVLRQQAKWYRGELQPGDRLTGLRLRVDAVCIQNEDGGFFHPLPPGRLWFLSAAARWTLAVLPFGKKGKR